MATKTVSRKRGRSTPRRRSARLSARRGAPRRRSEDIEVSSSRPFRELRGDPAWL
jgi:hypothetical protein